MGLGILHHLDDEEALHCLRFVHGALKPGVHAGSQARDFSPGTLCRRACGRNIRTELFFSNVKNDPAHLTGSECISLPQ
jgi:hypothetical protein